MAFSGDPIGGNVRRRQTRRLLNGSNDRAARGQPPPSPAPYGATVPRDSSIALLPGQTADKVEPLKLLQLLLHAKSTVHETLVYNPATGSSHVNAKAGGSTPLHSWRGVYPTAEAALLAAREVGLEPTGIYYDLVELDPSLGNTSHGEETTPLGDADPAPLHL